VFKMDDRRIKEIIAGHVDIALNVNDIKSGDFLDNIGINSINFIRIVIEIENEFGISFDVDYLGFEVYENIQALLDYVSSLKQSSM
jgi:hypothetical protein